jgi:hypothetical protein
MAELSELRKRQRVLLAMSDQRRLPGTIQRISSVAVYVKLDIGGVYRVPAADVSPFPSRPDLLGAAERESP